MGDETGRSYEILTQVIFQSILGQKEFPNLVVKRNVTLRGRTGSHQIDIYWRFEVGGVPFEVIVQAKDWQRRVDQLHLLAFRQILDDLPGQPRGIFVTRSGYQKGAREFALAHGILIYELREAMESSPLCLTVGGWAKFWIVRVPLQGTVRCEGEESNVWRTYAMDFVYDVCTPHFSDINFDIPRTWLEQEYPTQDLSDVRRVEIPLATLTDILLYDQKGAAVSNLQVLFSRLIEPMKEQGVNQKELSHDFAEPTFIRVTSSLVPCLIKVNSVSANVNIEHRHETRRGKMSGFSQLVLRQLNSDQTWWFAATPSAISSLEKD